MIHNTQSAQVLQEQDKAGMGEYILWDYEYYTVEKKGNALIIHSAMETWKVTIIRNFIILCLYPLSKILHSPSLDSEPGTPLTLDNTCFLLSSGIFF